VANDGLPERNWVWYRVEHTLSIHSITTRRREVFYWLTVSFTFALGTAAGDPTASQLHFGFVGSIVLFAVVMAVPALGSPLGPSPLRLSGGAAWSARQPVRTPADRNDSRQG
jgi:hypothetical protein